MKKSTIESHYHGIHPLLNTIFSVRIKKSMYHKPTGERAFPKEMAEQRLSWTGKQKEDTNK